MSRAQTADFKIHGPSNRVFRIPGFDGLRPNRRSTDVIPPLAIGRVERDVGNDSDGESNGEDPTDDDPENIDNGFDVEPGTTIELKAATTEWIGISPSQIKGVSNPTLTLQDGAAYQSGWFRGDQNTPSIAISDENDDKVDQLITEQMTVDEISGPEDHLLEFTASEEMARYACLPHLSNMFGDTNIAD